MTPERHRRLMDLFDEVCDLEEPERAARVAEVRAEDASLADELASLLAADQSGGKAIDEAAAAIAAEFTLVQPGPPARRSAQVPTRIGRYRVLRLLGEGGMGTVFEAEQERPQRKVAVKVIRGQLATPSLRKRFELETHILGRLSHPGVCRIYEAAFDADSCYFAMELVEGKPLGAYADEKRLSPEERLGLLARICDAVHHAHLRGVIHLDLKPANILVGDDGQPKVLDFGIARIVDPDLAMSGLTLTGQVLGTPAYMSPEQTALAPDALDARSDVYTLGAIGYELLAGKLPHDVKGKAVPEIVRLIREEDPEPLGSLRPELRGDVETIVGKALARDPDARYQSAAALAEDLRRHLGNEPIEARAPTAAYQLYKFAQRNRGLVAALGALALALVAGTVVSALLAARAERARATLATRNDALTVLEARASLLEDPTRAAARLKTLSRHGAWDDALAVGREAEALGVARELLVGHESEVHAVGFAPGGERLATASYDGTLRLWDLAGHRARVVKLPHEVNLVAWSGDRVAVAGAGGELDVVRDGAPLALAGHEGWIQGIAWAPGGSLLASAGDDGTVRLWRSDGTPGRVLSGHAGRVNDVAFDGEGARLASAGVDGTVRLWGVDGAALATLRGHDGEVDEVVFAEGGAALVSAGRDGRVVRWSLPDGARRTLFEGGDEIKHLLESRGTLAWSGREGSVRVLAPGAAAPRVVTRHQSVVRALVFSPDGQLLASAGDDRTIHLVFVGSGDTTVLLGHEARVRGLAFSDDGKELASVSDDGTGRVWPARRPMPAGGRRVAASARGGMAVAGSDRAIRLYRPDGEMHVLLGHIDEIYQMAFSPDGARLASASRDRTVRLWDANTGAALLVLPCPGRAVQVTFGPGRIAAGIHMGAIMLWDLDGGHERVLAGHTDRVNALAFTDGGGTLISASEDATVRSWELASGDSRVLSTLPDRVTALAVAADGRIAAGAGDGSLRVVRAGGGEDFLVGHRGEITALSWSPDGRTLASGSIDRTVRLWREGRTVAILAGPAGSVVTLGYAGAELVVGGSDGTLRVLGEGGGRLLTRGHGPVLDAALVGEDRAAVVNDEDGLRVVPLGAPGREADVRRFLDALTTTTVDDTGALAEHWLP